MKKNYVMRFAAVLLVLVLLSTCVVSGTFAKYVTKGEATDTATVAKWGVTISAEATDNKEYNGDTFTTEESAVLKGETKLLAPGSGVNSGNVNVSGTPEVAVKVSYAAEVTFTNWTADYMPLVFVINGTQKITGATVADIKTALEAAIATYSKSYAPNTDLASKLNEELTVSCYWAFSTSAENDIKDTALGDAAAGTNVPTVSLKITCTVEQLDEFN